MMIYRYLKELARPVKVQLYQSLGVITNVDLQGILESVSV